MLCPRCRNENREGRRFCAECGGPLGLACSVCGFLNEAGEKFCGGLATMDCSAAMPIRQCAPVKADSRRKSAEGEKHSVLVLLEGG